jgi:hypothetical protein
VEVSGGMDNGSSVKDFERWSNGGSRGTLWHGQRGRRWMDNGW